MKEPTVLEEIVLTSILRLKDNAYGVMIRQKVAEVTKKELIYGTLYNTLDQLVRKGFVTKSRGMPVSERGGRRKIYYRVTPRGIQALQEAQELQSKIWDGIRELIKE